MRSEQPPPLWQSDVASKYSLRRSSLWNLHPFIQPLSALIVAQFCVIGTGPIDPVDHFVVAGQWREDVEAVAGGNAAELLDRFEQLQQKARLRTGKFFPIVTIQEAGLDGFWIHRLWRLTASRATSSTQLRSRPPVDVGVQKTDKIDGEALTRTSLAFKRGEPRVCAIIQSARFEGRRSASDLPTIALFKTSLVFRPVSNWL
ncbi:hypothetical protein P3T31_004283 [Rhizobium sp. AN70]|nr:hypothetical protein [Rhizobium sp. AN70]